MLAYEGSLVKCFFFFLEAFLFQAQKENLAIQKASSFTNGEQTNVFNIQSLVKCLQEFGYRIVSLTQKLAFSSCISGCPIIQSYYHVLRVMTENQTKLGWQ